MADTIVVLDSSDDDDDVRKVNKTPLKSAHTKNSKRASQLGSKRKIQPNDDELTTSKRMLTTYQEDLRKARNFADQHLGGTPLLPLMTAVETLATPSATPPLQLLASPPRNVSSVREIDKGPSDVDLGSPKSTEKTARRVKFTTILKESDDAWQQVRQKRLASSTSVQLSGSSTPTPSDVVAADNEAALHEIDIKDMSTDSPIVFNATKLETSPTTEDKEKRMPLEEKLPLEKEYEELIKECRKADPSQDMEKLIETKLLKYYYSVHPDFVKSRGFRKNVCSTTERIRAEPELVYYNLKTVVDELNVRRKSKDVIITNDETTTSSGTGTTGSKHTEEQIKKLNKALYILKKRIARLEEAEVDWEDEDSSYLQVERFKKRACQIYEKICDLTGESKNARRLVKKPIQFSGTSYPAFNKTLQAYINRTKEFPDFFDVLRMLEHCNRQYDLKLASFEVKRIAQDAFIKVGKLLQTRRKTDLYETVAHFTANSTDPATADSTLLAKLKENEKTRTKISEVIEKYARAQDDPDAAAELQLQSVKVTDQESDNIEENGQFESEKAEDCLVSDDSDENEDEEDDENLDIHVEKLTQDNTVDISDVDTDTEITNDAEAEKTTAKQVEFNDKCAEKESVKEKNEKTQQNNNDVQLTENNNIMRTKTNESNLTIEDANGISKSIGMSASADDNGKIIITLPEKSKSTDDITTVNKNQASSEIITKIVKTKPASKTLSNTAKHRTIAEIVISDEE